MVTVIGLYLTILLVIFACVLNLLLLFHHIASAYNKKGSQIDIAVLDFFLIDTVSHDGLLSKVKHYGIDDKI